MASTLELQDQIKEKIAYLVRQVGAIGTDGDEGTTRAINNLVLALINLEQVSR